MSLIIISIMTSFQYSFKYIVILVGFSKRHWQCRQHCRKYDLHACLQLKSLSLKQTPITCNNIKIDREKLLTPKVCPLYRNSFYKVSDWNGHSQQEA